MIRITGSNISMICDVCDTKRVTMPGRDFNRLSNEARVRNWDVEPDPRGGWRHVCYDCRNLDGLEALK